MLSSFTLDSGEQYTENVGKNGWKNRETYRVLSLSPSPHLTPNENLSNRTFILRSEDPLHGHFFMSHIYYTEEKRIPITRDHQCEVSCCPCLFLRPAYVQQDCQVPNECHMLSEQQTIHI
jgi:hypothetical protein